MSIDASIDASTRASNRPPATRLDTPSADSSAERGILPGAVPDPGVRLPQVAVPTILVWVVSMVVWAGATAAALAVVDGSISAWWLLASIPAHTAVTFTVFTCLHESVHHAAGRKSWVNEVLGRLSMPFVVLWGTYPMFKFIHIEHHRNTNEGSDVDPDAWTSEGPTWQLPLRWSVVDLHYARFYVPRLARRPRREAVGFVANLVVVIALLVALVATGHGAELLLVYVVPQRLGLCILAWWFDWLPHHDLEDTAATDRFRATRIRVGWERVMTPLMFSQNYHLVHHIHPAIPFYRYVQAWRRTEQDYLERGAPLATAWGTALTPEEYLAWRGLTDQVASAPARDRFHALTVARVDRLTPDAVALVFDVPEDLREVYRHRPGQHLVVRTSHEGRELRRSYSICTTPSSGELKIAIKRVEGGAFSNYANDVLRAGDVLDVLPPVGRFVLTDAPAKPRVLVAVAAGSGITPVLSILSTALEQEPDARATLLYANLSRSSTMFADQIDRLADELAGRLDVVHVFDGADADQPVTPHARAVAGRLGGDLLDELITTPAPDGSALLDADEWYLCGPAGLTDAVIEVLTSRGVAPERLHRELFVAPAGPTTPGAPGVAAKLTVVLDGERTVLDARPDETVLDAALRAGVAAPYSCAAGACGTCVARLRVGTVDVQQDYALDDDDRAAGRVLTCQSRASSPEVEVDYDNR